MKYIMEFPKAVSLKQCETLLNVRDDTYKDFSYWSNLEGEFQWVLDTLNNIVEPFTESYTKQFHLKSGGFFLEGFGIIRQPQGAYDSFHYDTPLLALNNKITLRPFVCLIYLNENYEGGQLVFPVQKQTVSPEMGKVVIFPASYMFPHQVLPVVGGDRCFVRLNYAFDSSAVDEDTVDDWDITKDGVQCFK